MSNLENVQYIEPSDFNADMSLKPYVNNGKPVLVMVQSMNCGHCSSAKPAYQQLFNNNDLPCVIAAMQVEEFQPLANKLQQLDPSFGGVPTYWIFGKDGKFIAPHQGGRDVNSLKSSISKYC